MRTDQAKAIHMRDLLSRLGYEPEREDRSECWYVSPFRQETEASFKITGDGKGWFDHGMGKGGNILNFVMDYESTDVRGALRFLDSLAIKYRSSIGESIQGDLWNGTERATEALTVPERGLGTDNHNRRRGENQSLKITKIQPLQNKALIHYLKQRGINAEIASAWVQEMYYWHNEKPYFALAFVNDNGGHELRNPYFKRVIGPKDITAIRAGEGDTTKVVVFEGFIDFLSAITLAGRAPSMPVIVLNSVAMQNKAIETIRQMGIETVHLYRDRDEAGQTLFDNFKEHLHDINIYDESVLYDGYKDINDYLIARIRTVLLAR